MLAIFLVCYCMKCQETYILDAHWRIFTKNSIFPRYYGRTSLIIDELDYILELRFFQKNRQTKLHRYFKKEISFFASMEEKYAIIAQKYRNLLNILYYLAKSLYSQKCIKYFVLKLAKLLDNFQKLRLFAILYYRHRCSFSQNKVYRFLDNLIQLYLPSIHHLYPIPSTPTGCTN